MATTPYDLGSLIRLYNARRLQGATQPGELEALVKAKLGAEAASNREGRSLALQAERDAEQRRQNLINEQLTREQIKAGEYSSLGQLGTTGLGFYWMTHGGKNNADRTVSGDGNAVTNSLNKIGGGLSSGYDWLKGKITGNTASAVGAATSIPITEQSVLPWNPSGDTEAHTALVNPEITPGTSTNLNLQETSPGVWEYAVPVAGGLAGEALARKTRLGERISNVMPMGGSQDWNRAAGAGTAAGLAAMSGASPWYAAAGYLASAIGLKKLFG